MNPRDAPRDDTYATSVMMGDAFESSRAVAGLHLQGLECSSADSRRRDFISWLFVVTRESGTSSIARATSVGLWVCDIRSVQIGASRVRERASSRADDACSSHRCRNRASRARRKFHPSSVPDLGETARRREINNHALVESSPDPRRGAKACGTDHIYHPLFVLRPRDHRRSSS